MDNPLILDSVMFRLIQVAENNDKLSIEFRDENKLIPWQSIKGMRNRIVHDYGFLNKEIVEDTIRNSIPNLYFLLSERYKKI